MPFNNPKSDDYGSIKEKIGRTGGPVAHTECKTGITGSEAKPSGKDKFDVFLDYAVTDFVITYSLPGDADSTSKGENRTCRQHEFAHVGADKSFANKGLLQELCAVVQAKWTFAAADEQAVGEKLTKYTDAISTYLSGVAEYLDEYVVHEQQRHATPPIVGVKTDGDLNAMLNALQYTDPVDGSVRQPKSDDLKHAIQVTKQGAMDSASHVGATPDFLKLPPKPTGTSDAGTSDAGTSDAGASDAGTKG